MWLTDESGAPQLGLSPGEAIRGPLRPSSDSQSPTPPLAAACEARGGMRPHKPSAPEILSANAITLFLGQSHASKHVAHAGTSMHQEPSTSSSSGGSTFFRPPPRRWIALLVHSMPRCRPSACLRTCWASCVRGGGEATRAHQYIRRDACDGWKRDGFCRIASHPHLKRTGIHRATPPPPPLDRLRVNRFRKFLVDGFGQLGQCSEIASIPFVCPPDMSDVTCK